MHNFIHVRNGRYQCPFQYYGGPVLGTCQSQSLKQTACQQTSLQLSQLKNMANCLIHQKVLFHLASCPFQGLLGDTTMAYQNVDLLPVSQKCSLPNSLTGRALEVYDAVQQALLKSAKVQWHDPDHPLLKVPLGNLIRFQNFYLLLHQNYQATYSYRPCAPSVHYTLN